jgi:hypothetical protein
MSLHIDLFKDNERSNPSGKILLTTMITAAVVILIGLALYVFQTFFMLQASQSALARAQRRNDEMKQNHKLALTLIADIAEARACLTEMTAFSNAQAQVAAQLYAIAVSVPEDIQLTQLSISESLVAAGAKNDIPARLYRGAITGRTAADGVNERIRSVIDDMNGAEGLLGKVTPGGVSVDPTKSSDRIFEINFALEPRLYRQAQEVRSK